MQTLSSQLKSKFLEDKAYVLKSFIGLGIVHGAMPSTFAESIQEQQRHTALRT